jgi:hypothetical protein
MPHCNDEEAGGIKQKHDNEQIAYSGYLIDTFETSDDNVDSDNNCLIENSTKEEIFENPFKNETWFYMKNLMRIQLQEAQQKIFLEKLQQQQQVK